MLGSPCEGKIGRISWVNLGKMCTETGRIGLGESWSERVLRETTGIRGISGARHKFSATGKSPMNPALFSILVKTPPNEQ